MKNIAGNDVAIFLFRFELIEGNRIDFVVNEAIAEDMYPDIDAKMKPLVHVCCETLLRYRHLSVSPTIMDGNFLVTGEFEVMLSKGLGHHLAFDEKQRLFQDAKRIADLLDEVMARSTEAMKKGMQHTPHPIDRTPNPKKIKKGLEELGKAKFQEEALGWIVEGQKIRPGLKPWRPDDLPCDVTASRGYDHRGLSYVFEHKQYGELGRIIMIKMDEEKMLMQSDFCLGQEAPDSALAKMKKALFEEVIARVSAGFNGL